MQNPNQMPKQEQLNVLNRIHSALGLLKIEGAQAELMVELRKGIAVVNNAIHAEIQPVNGEALQAEIAS